MSVNIPLVPPQNQAVRNTRSFATLRTIFALMLREMSSTYGRSPGGYLWAIIEPTAGIALLTIIFSAAFQAPPLGVSFAMFYASGLLPFLLFTDLHGKIATSLMFSKQLLAYPSVTFFDAILARFFLNLITLILVGYLIFGGILLTFNTRVVLDFPSIILAYTMGASLSLGLGTLNAYLFTRFHLMQRAWSILMRPLFVISGVFIPFETVPQPFQDYLWYNPLIHIIGMLRHGLYSTYEANYVSCTYVFALTGIGLGFGLLLLRRNSQDILAL